jgi:hypothetical protein
MTDQSFPITPPAELVEQWKRTAPHRAHEPEHYHYITLCAAQWGADQELEACCNLIYKQEGSPFCGGTAEWLRAARRPKPPSLKEQALEVFEALIHGDASELDVGVIRLALEALPND